jgi:hypothetical protein
VSEQGLPDEVLEPCPLWVLAAEIVVAAISGDPAGVMTEIPNQRWGGLRREPLQGPDQPEKNVVVEVFRVRIGSILPHFGEVEMEPIAHDPTNHWRRLLQDQPFKQLLPGLWVLCLEVGEQFAIRSLLPLGLSNKFCRQFPRQFPIHSSVPLPSSSLFPLPSSLAHLL